MPSACYNARLEVRNRPIFFEAVGTFHERQEAAGRSIRNKDLWSLLDEAVAASHSEGMIKLDAEERPWLCFSNIGTLE
jgi:hypothetical protein